MHHRYAPHIPATTKTQVRNHHLSHAADPYRTPLDDLVFNVTWCIGRADTPVNGQSIAGWKRSHRTQPWLFYPHPSPLHLTQTTGENYNYKYKVKRYTCITGEQLVKQAALCTPVPLGQGLCITQLSTPLGKYQLGKSDVRVCDGLVITWTKVSPVRHSPVRSASCRHALPP